MFKIYNKNTLINSITIAHKNLKMVLARNAYLKKQLEAISKEKPKEDPNTMHLYTKSLKTMQKLLTRSIITMEQHVADYKKNQAQMNMSGGYNNLFIHPFYNIYGNKYHITYDQILKVLQNSVEISKTIELENRSLESKIGRLQQTSQIQPEINEKKERTIPITWKDFDELKINIDVDVYKPRPVISTISPAETSTQTRSPKDTFVQFVIEK